MARLYIQQTPNLPRVRIDHALERRDIHHPGRFAGEGIRPPFVVLYVGGLIRDLVDDKQAYRFGPDFPVIDGRDAYEKAAMTAGHWCNGDLVSSWQGRGELNHLADLEFWRTIVGHTPRFFSSLIAGLIGELPGTEGELPFTCLDPASQSFIQTHFRPQENVDVPLL